MAKIGKRLLDLGAAKDKIGTASVELDSTTRHFVNVDRQSFGGKKTFNAPPKTMAAPIAPDDAVPKFGLEQYTRCVANPITETLTLTADDIASGYVLLSKNIAPGQAESLEVLDFPGAVGLALGKDYTAVEPAKMVFTGYNLGNPGMLLVGQEITVKYNTCRERVSRDEDFPAIDIAGMWALEPYWYNEDAITTYDYPRASVMERMNDGIIITGAMSGRTIYFRNMRTYERMSVTIPNLASDLNEQYKLFFAAGKLHLCQLPLMRKPADGLENNVHYFATPYFAGSYACYVHDGTGWREAFTASVDEAMNQEGQQMVVDYGLSSYGIYGNPIADIVAWGQGKIALINAWLPCDTADTSEIHPFGRPQNARITARVYETESYTQVERLSHSVSGADGPFGSARIWNCYVNKGYDGNIAASGQNSVNDGSLVNVVKSITANRDYDALPISYSRHFIFPYAEWDGETYRESVYVGASYTRSDWDGMSEFKPMRLVTSPRMEGVVLAPDGKSIGDYLAINSFRRLVFSINGTHYICELINSKEIADEDNEGETKQVDTHLVVALHIATQSAQNLSADNTFMENLAKVTLAVPEDPNGVEPGTWLRGPVFMGLMY